MSATHIGIPSDDGIPESLVIMSHFDACVPRRSITRSKSNIGTVAPGWETGRRRIRLGAVGGRCKVVTSSGKPRLAPVGILAMRSDGQITPNVGQARGAKRFQLSRRVERGVGHRRGRGAGRGG